MDNKNTIKLLLFIIAMAVLVTCNDGEDEVTPREYPRINTLDVSSISENGATFNAEIIYPGNGAIIEYGFVWGENIKPTIASFDKTIQTENITTGFFSAAITTTLKEGIKYYVRAYAKNDTHLVYGKTVEFMSLGSGAPEITSLIPDFGTIGDTILIYGSGFSYNLDDNDVMIGEVRPTKLHSSDSTISIVIPTSLTTKLNAVSVSIIENKYEYDSFELINPVIEKVDPIRATYLDVITVSGKHFSSITEENKVLIGQTEVEVISSSREQIQVRVPTNIDTQESQISVLIGPMTTTFNDLFQLKPFEIISVSKIGANIGSLVKITGINFNPEPSFNKIYLNDYLIEVISSSKEELQFKISDYTYENRANKLAVKIAGQEIIWQDDFEITDTWFRRRDYPGLSRNYVLPLSTSNNGFLIGGHLTTQNYNDPGPFNEIWEYDPTSNSWNHSLNYPGYGTWQLLGFSFENKIYVGGGWSNRPNDKAIGYDFWEYNIPENSWSQKSDIPNFLGHVSAKGVEVNNKGYYLSNLSGYLIEYDPIGDTWTHISDFPGEPRFNTNNFVIGDKAYFGGGTTAASGGDFYTDFWEYDPSINTWSRIASIPEEIRYEIAQSFSLKGKGYVNGDSKIWEYDPNTNQWTVHGNLARRWYNSNVFVVNDKAYFSMGYYNGNGSEETWEFDPNLP